MVNESLEVFCNRNREDFDKKDGDFCKLSIIKVKRGEENLVRIKVEKGKTPARDFFRGFLQDLLNEYSEEYDNKLLEFWKNEKIVTEEKTSTSEGRSNCLIELTENGKEEEVYYGHSGTQVYFKKLQDMLNKMKEKKPKSKFADDLKNLMLECYRNGEESNEQNDSQPLKNDIQKEDNNMNLAEKVKKAMKNKQIIFTGAPGTGKTYSVRKVVEEETDGDKTAYKFVQFHPSYDYSDFVEGLRPVVLLGQTEPTFVRMDGTFKAFCRHVVEENRANDGEDEKYYFIVDEINRGDLSKIFGELMFGLEESYRGEENAFDTQYKNLKTYRVLETADLGSNICGKEILPEDIGHAVPVENDVFEKGFYIPKNLYFVGTMNDIDRSVDSMDFALRRRFMWMEIKANEVMKPSMLDMYSDQCEEIKKKIEEISERIVKMNEAMTSSDFRNLGLTEAYHIGPAYFKKLDPQNLEESLREVFDNNVVSILREYLRGRRKDEVDKLINTCKKNLFPEEKSSGEN